MSDSELDRAAPRGAARRKSIRTTALLLGALAVAVYAAFIVLSVFR